MKRVLIVVTLVLAMFCVTGQAEAVILPPTGGFGSPTPMASPGGTLLASLSIPFNAVDYNGKTWSTGTLTQNVLRNATGILFEYRITVNAGSLAPITTMDTTDYDSFMTDVDTDNSGILPATFSRLAPGSSIMFSYATVGGIPGGSNSALMWVQTNAPTFQRTGTTQLQGTGNTRLNTFAPAAPEPATMGLLGMGLLGLGGLVRRKRFRA